MYAFFLLFLTSYYIANGPVYGKHRKPTTCIIYFESLMPIFQEKPVLLEPLTPSEGKERGIIMAKGIGWYLRKVEW